MILFGSSIARPRTSAACGMWWLLTSIFLSCWVPSASAQPLSSEAQRALVWLQSQARPDGSLSGENGAVATPTQTRGEAVWAAALAGSDLPTLAAALNGAGDDNTEFVARRGLALAAAGRPGASLIESLWSRQNSDGGIGASPGYSSSSLDTAWLLLASRVAGLVPAARTERAVSYLLANAQSNGSYGNAEPEMRPYLAAHVLFTLQQYAGVHAVGTGVQRTRNWLLAQQQAGSYGRILNNAMATIALAATGPDQSAFASALTALKQAQQSNGSWADDPFLTALALRALVTVELAGQTPTTGSLSLVVLSASGHLPLAGARVDLLDTAGVSAVLTDAEGRAIFTQLTPASYSIQISAVGYLSTTRSSVVVAGGQSSLGNVLLFPDSQLALLRGKITSGADGSPLAGVLINSTSGAQSLTTTSNSAGQYELAGVNPGAVHLRASKTGYQAIDVDAAIKAGAAFIFSPALYADSETPPALSTLRGRVIAEQGGQPIPGAMISVGGESATSTVDGTFELTGLNSGLFTGRVLAVGYQQLELSGLLTAGPNQMGDLRLRSTVVQTSTALRGQITDRDTGEPIANASISITGHQLTALSAVDGQYQINGISTTAFAVQIRAAGYTGQIAQISGNDHGEVELNVQLDLEAASGLLFESAFTDRPGYDPFSEVRVAGELRNETTQNRSIAFWLVIRDGAGEIIAEVPEAPAGVGGGIYSQPHEVPANGRFAVSVAWYPLNRPAGTYGGTLRAQDAGTGRVVTERAVSFRVNAKAIVSGGLALSPPITQAGSNQPIQLTAELRNGGNLPIAAGSAELTVTVINVESAGPQSVANIVPVIELTQPGNQRGLQHDAAGNHYVLQPSTRSVLKIAPAGTPVLTEFTLPTSISGTAVSTPADFARDAAGNLWFVTQSGQIVYKPLTASSRLLNSGLTASQFMEVDPSGNVYVSGDIGGYRQVNKVSPQGQVEILATNGLDNPLGLVVASNGGLFVANNRDNTIAKVSASGAISPFASGLNRPTGIVLAGNGDLLVANSGSNSIVRVNAAGQLTTFASGPLFNNPVDVAATADGGLIVANSGNSSLLKVDAAGQSTLFARAYASRPEDLLYDNQGQLLIASFQNNQLVRLPTVNDEPQVVASANQPLELESDEAQNIFYVNSSGELWRVPPSAAPVRLLSGLNDAKALAQKPSGPLYVGESGLNRISTVSAQGQRSTVLESPIENPFTALLAGDGATYLVNQLGVSKLGSDGLLRVLYRTVSEIAFDATVAPSGTVYVRENNRIARIEADGSRTSIYSGLPTGRRGLIAISDTEFLISDNAAIRKVDASGIRLHVALPGLQPSTLLANPDGSLFVQTASAIEIIDAQLVVRRLATTSTSVNLARGPDGNLLIAEGTSIRRVDPLSGTKTLLFNAAVAPVALAVTADGKLGLAYQNRLQTHDSNGQLLDQLFGFSTISNMTWQGDSLYLLSRDNVLRWRPGENLRLMATVTGALALAADGTRLLVGVSAGIRQIASNGTVTNFASYPSNCAVDGIAARTSDGQISASCSSMNSIVNYSSAGTVVWSSVSPTGLKSVAVASNGEVYAAGNSYLARFSPNGRQSSVFAPDGGIQQFRFDAQGRLVGVFGNVLRTYENGGYNDQPATAAPFTVGALALGSNGIYVAMPSINRIDRAAPGVPRLFAAGISGPGDMEWQPDGSVLIADFRSNQVSRISVEGVSAHSGDFISQPNVMRTLVDGRLLVGGAGAQLTIVEVGGMQASLSLPSQLGLGGNRVLGIERISGSADEVAILVEERGVFRMQLPPTPVLPTPGTVLLARAVSMPELPVGDSVHTISAGTFVPQYGGDYEIKLRPLQNSVTGHVSNSLHAGPYAKGLIQASRQRLKPGSADLSLDFRIQGADFTSIARVERDRLQPVVVSPYPGAMATDRLGNFYVAETHEGAGIYRVAADGAQSLISPVAVSNKGDMPLDSSGNLYFAAVSNKRSLQRLKPNGDQEPFATLPADILSLAMNGQGQIFVLTKTDIYRVSESGMVEEFSVAGLSNPYSLSMDGNENLWVQNDKSVLRIAPDRTSRVVIDDPSLYWEAEGHNIVGDCAGNAFIVPYTWPRFNQSGEEHTILQVNGRSGVPAVVVDTLTVNSLLDDIDFSYFDHFTNNFYFWGHSTVSRIWRLPVTCGSITTSLHAVAPSGQPVSGFTPAPDSNILRPDGSRELVWILREVSNLGRSVRFDTTLQGLELGQTREVLREAYLNFSNTFAPGSDVRLNLDIPRLPVENVVLLDLALDAISYPQASPVLADLDFNNTDTVAIAGRLIVDVRDGSGARVETVVDEALALGPQELRRLTRNWNTAGYLAGPYKMRAELKSADGTTLAFAEQSFAITAGNGAGTTISSSITADKRQYQVLERVELTANVRNLTANQILPGLTVVETVRDPSGTVFQSFTQPAFELGFSAVRTFGFSFELPSSSTAGTYQVEQRVLSANGVLLHTASTSFTVLNSAATGNLLSGALTATPAEVTSGTSVVLRASVRNRGNANASAIPVNLSIVDPQSEAVLASWDRTIDLDRDANMEFEQTWTTTRIPGGAYVAVLSTSVAGQSRLLAETNLSVVESNVVLTSAQTLTSETRLLMLLECQDSKGLADAACTLSRKAFVEAELTRLGIRHKVVTTGSEFRTELRCGAWNSYWMAGSARRLFGDVAEELREAVFRGDAVLVDGARDAQQNARLEPMLGVSYLGLLPASNPLVTIDPGLFSAGSLNAAGSAQRFQLAGGVRQARFADGSPAIVTASFGTGRTTLFAFDLLATHQAAAGSQSAELIETALSHVRPSVPAAYTGRAFASLNTRVGNPQSLARTFELRLTLPEGSELVDTSPAATISPDGVVRWRLPLAGFASTDLRLNLRVPLNAGSYPLTGQLDVLEGSTLVPVSSPQQQLIVRGGNTYTQQLRDQLTALSLADPAEQSARAAAIAALDRAGVELGSNHFDLAIAAYIDSAEAIAELRSIDFATLRSHNAELLHEAQQKGCVDSATCRIAVADVSQLEGNSGQTAFRFVVTATPPGVGSSQLQFSTSADTATAGSDFLDTTLALNLQSDQQSVEVSVPVLGDTESEPDERFTVQLGNPGGSCTNLSRGSATGTIRNDDAVQLTLTDAGVDEGDAGFTVLTVPVRLLGVSSSSVGVDYSLVAVNASPGSDFVAMSGRLEFEPGTQLRELAINIVGDRIVEPDERLELRLSNASGASLAQSVAVLTIRNDDLASLSLAPVSIVEGDAGQTTTRQLALRSSHPSASPIRVQYSTGGGNATVGTDYLSLSGTATIAGDGSTQEVLLPLSVIGDNLIEGNESLNLLLANPEGATLGASSIPIEILDDDSGLSVSIADQAVVEADLATSTAQVLVSLSDPAPVGGTSIDWIAVPGTALAGSDFVAASGTLQIPAGASSAPLSIGILADRMVEPTETFTVRLSNPRAVTYTLIRNEALVTISDTDTATLSLQPAALAEGNSGTRPLSFVGSLSQPVQGRVRLQLGTADGSATVADQDYLASSGLMEFDGSTGASFAVSIVGDLKVEPDQQFQLLAGALQLPAGISAVKLNTASATGTILNDDGTTISTVSSGLGEGNVGGSDLRFTLSLSAPSKDPVTLNYATADGTALAGSDYVARSGSLIFAAGSTEQTVLINVLGDRVVEADESVDLLLSNVSGASLGATRVSATIRNDDSAVLSISSPAQPEGDVGTSPMSFVLSLSNPVDGLVGLDYTTADGSATLADNDYQARSGKLSFAAGSSTLNVNVPIVGDSKVEPNQSFELRLAALSLPAGISAVSLQAVSATGTIQNDDGTTLSIAPAISVAEGNSGERNLVFPLSLSAPSKDPVTVNYSTTDGSARAGLDYRATSGTLTLSPALSSHAITVSTLGDTVLEADESFTLTLSAPTGATLSQSVGTGTIVNDDSTALSIEDVSEREGSGQGSTPFVFTVRLSAAAEIPVSVDYATADGSAVAGLDYQATSGQLTIPAGSSFVQFSVPVIADTVPEPPEQFRLNLSAPSPGSGVQLADSQAIANIVDDDLVTQVPLGGAWLLLLALGSLGLLQLRGDRR